DLACKAVTGVRTDPFGLCVLHGRVPHGRSFHMKRSIRFFGVVAISLLWLACDSGGNTPTGGTSAIGGACTSAASCLTGLTCNSDPGGQCTKSCMRDSDCPTGSRCDPGGSCYHSCATNADCTRTGYTCVGNAGHMVCDVVPTADAGPGDAALTDATSADVIDPRCLP